MVSKIVYVLARIVAAFIMLQTLYFKFSGAEESIYIFESVGMEPWGRYAVGVIELIASILILIPKTAWIGGVLTAGVMFGALAMHIAFLGVEVQGDGGTLFIFALVTMLCGTYVMHVNRRTIEGFFRR